MPGDETKDGLMSFLINAASFGLMKAKNEADKEKKEEDEKAKNEDIDKRKEMGDIGGFLKSKGLTDEDIEHVYKIMEKLSYDKSSTGTADNAKNKCKNGEDEEDGEKEKKYKEFKEKTDETVENKKAKNAFEENKNKFYEGGNTEISGYVSRADRLKAGEEYFKVGE